MAPDLVAWLQGASDGRCYTVARARPTTLCTAFELTFTAVKGSPWLTQARFFWGNSHTNSIKSQVDKINARRVWRHAQKPYAQS